MILSVHDFLNDSYFLGASSMFVTPEITSLLEMMEGARHRAVSVRPQVGAPSLNASAMALAKFIFDISFLDPATIYADPATATRLNFAIIMDSRPTSMNFISRFDDFTSGSPWFQTAFQQTMWMSRMDLSSKISNFSIELQAMAYYKPAVGKTYVGTVCQHPNSSSFTKMYSQIRGELMPRELRFALEIT